MHLAEKFGRNVRHARLAKGSTIEALADQVGLAYSYVGQIERGTRNPTLAVVERFAVVLEMDAVELLKD
ncbi:MAG: XRE family transcriptional regulator [Caulobacteraceae bacterium]|nr:XRE family transcriptional regulator [Caulobacteraceae bacterium]